MENLTSIINDFGFPLVGLASTGYFIFYIWKFINQILKPEMGKMHTALIRVIDQQRMLDQDMIRLQQKVNVILDIRMQQEVVQDAKEKEALERIRSLSDEEKKL
jgi:hypothetical protein|tara:strand:+ start:43 stop:354 length:312 start_codon:yes stop_codon:yes gene_type:complete